MKNETVSLEVAIEAVLRNGPTFETIAGLCKMAVEASEAQQEPVAVVSGYYGGQCVILPIDPARIFNSNTPLYTSPPAQRKPLTTKEIREWWASENGLEDCAMSKLDDFEQVVRAVEAKHNIKENT